MDAEQLAREIVDQCRSPGELPDLGCLYDAVISRACSRFQGHQPEVSAALKVSIRAMLDARHRRIRRLQQEGSSDEHV